MLLVICQFSRDVIGNEDLECHWYIDPSIVTIKQSLNDCLINKFYC